MPVNLPAVQSEFPAIFMTELHPIQAVLFVLLLLAVSVCDIKYRKIPDGLQFAIGSLTFLCFSPSNLLGIFNAFPYLAVALFFHEGNGMGGGDIKLAAAIGIVLGLSDSLTASAIGLAAFILYGMTYTALKKVRGQKRKISFPVGPFLAAGSIMVYFMKIGGMIL